MIHMKELPNLQPWYKSYQEVELEISKITHQHDQHCRCLPGLLLMVRRLSWDKILLQERLAKTQTTPLH